MVECRLPGMGEDRGEVVEEGREEGKVVDMGVGKVVGMGVGKVVGTGVDRVVVGSDVVEHALSGQCGRVVSMALVVGEGVVEEPGVCDG